MSSNAVISKVFILHVSLKFEKSCQMNLMNHARKLFILTAICVQRNVFLNIINYNQQEQSAPVLAEPILYYMRKCMYVILKAQF